jgi:TonB family protein
MKICPKCQQQFPNGFQYCPNDTEHLIAQEDFNRRTRPISAVPSARPAEPPISEVVPINHPISRDDVRRTPPVSQPDPRETLRPGPPISERPSAQTAYEQQQLREAQAREMQAREAQIREAQAREAQLREAQAREAQIREMQLREAQAREAQIREAQAREAQLREAQAREAQIREMQLREAQAREAEARELENRNAMNFAREQQQGGGLPFRRTTGPVSDQIDHNEAQRQTRPTQPRPAQGQRPSQSLGNSPYAGAGNFNDPSQSAQGYQRGQEPPRQQQPSGVLPKGRVAQPQQDDSWNTVAARSGQNSTVRPSQMNSGPVASLSFSMPNQGGFFARLIDNFKNIGDAFKSGGAPVPGGTGDFQFLLPEESLATRVGREFSNAAAEIKQDPKRFVGELIKGEGNNRFRRNALLAGSEMALVGYVTLYFISQIISSIKGGNGLPINGLFIGFAVYLGLCYLTRGFLLYKLINHVTGKLAAPKLALEFANWAPIIAILLFLVFKPNFNFYCMIFPGKCVPPEVKLEEPLEEIAMLDQPEFKPELKKAAVEKAKIGGSKPKPKAASGGGGGGRQAPTPPSKGVPPQMSLTPQIIPPNPEPPKIKNPTLVVASTIYGDPKAIPPMKGPIGDPTGVPAPPSPGPGTGAGIGRGAGTGVGAGEGGGLGPGRGGNVGGGNMGIGGGGSVEPMTASVRPKILYQEKAKYTEEARQNKIQGTVMLSVVFTGDGRIENIRVVRGLPDGLTEKAIEAAKRIRFQPAVKNGAPVSVRGTLEFTFNLY